MELYNGMNNYQLDAQRTSNSEGPEAKCMDKLLNGVMGLCGEAGECIDIVKKAMHQGHALDLGKLAEELGDVLWYCAETASGMGMSLADVAAANIDKLRKRYPDGFEAERSVHRGEEDVAN